MKYVPNAMKFGTQSRPSSLIINMIFEISNLDPKLKTWADLVSKLQCAPILMTLNANVAISANQTCIMNIVLGIDDLNPKL